MPLAKRALLISRGILLNRLNRKMEYALMALKHMSLKRPGELTTAKEVAETYRVPFDVMAKVMQSMSQKGVLKSEHGSSGGYQITKDLARVTVLDLIQLIQGSTKIAKCMVHEEGCDIQKSCNIISPVHQLNSKLNEFYRSLTLQELIAGNSMNQKNEVLANV